MSDYVPPLYDLGSPITTYQYRPTEYSIKPENPYDFHEQKKDVLTVAHVNSEISPTVEMQENMKPVDNEHPEIREYALTA